jgi:regulation of enolase protein 1 (concanavalin A-like superfamily)
VTLLPFDLRWELEPAAWRGDDRQLTIEAGPRTDLFRDPQGARPQLGAPRLIGDPPAGEWQLSARVAAHLRSTFDAGALILWAGEREWAKLAFERSPQGAGMVVSVVTRGLSDDCNSTMVGGDHVWLRVARVGAAFAFHASGDGERWDFVRHFALDADPAVGCLAQSPTGAGCAATFTAIRFGTTRLRDLRSGE